MIAVVCEAPADAGAVEALLDLSFGPERRLKTCERLRDGCLPRRGLALVAKEAGRLAGTLRFWDVDAGGVPALLLGPLAVDPGRRSRGIGAALVRDGLARAKRLGHEAVLLIGDPAYYGRFGFTRDLTVTLAMPGPVEPWRFLGLELRPGALLRAAGPVRAARPQEASPRDEKLAA